MALPLIRPRKKVPNTAAYISTIIGRMVYALGGNFYGTIRRGEPHQQLCLLVRDPSWFTQRIWAEDIGLGSASAREVKGLKLERNGQAFGTIISAGITNRARIVIESSDGRDVEAWADECGTHEHSAKVMRAAAILNSVKPKFSAT